MLPILAILLLICDYVATKVVQVPTKLLNDGNKIPVLGIGTFGVDEDIEKMRDTINWAIKHGYRHIDTAASYNNEVQIGMGIKDVISKGLVKREDLFVTTKLWGDSHHREDVVPAVRRSLQNLGLDYVDLFLIHSPLSRPDKVDYLETWKGMEEVKKLGLAKSIGVSNFNSVQIQRILSRSKTKPAVNQIEVHPAHTREDLVSYCHKNDIAVVAYSPFGYMVPRGNRSPADPPPPKVNDPLLLDLAQKYKKTTLQIVLRYLLDRDLIPIPKSTNEIRLRQNIDVFDFKLTPEEVKMINKFNKNKALFGWV